MKLIVTFVCLVETKEPEAKRPWHIGETWESGTAGEKGLLERAAEAASAVLLEDEDCAASVPVLWAERSITGYYASEWPEQRFQERRVCRALARARRGQKKGRAAAQLKGNVTGPGQAARGSGQKAQISGACVEA
jgi:hypothetical protein